MRGVKVLLFFACLSIVLFTYGFLAGVENVLNPQAEVVEVETEEVKKQVDTLYMVALGDSLTRGVGDSEGKGYVKRVREALLEDYGQETALANLAVSGATIDDLQQLLEQEGTKHTIEQADIIFLTIGGNDLFPGVDEFLAIDFESFEVDAEEFRTKSKTLLDTLRQMNQEATIYWLGLYNPFENIGGLGDTSSYVIAWNQVLEELSTSYEGVYMIPTYDLFQGEVDMYISTDQFHPNSEGYRLMAERLLGKITSQWGLGGE